MYISVLSRLAEKYDFFDAKCWKPRSVVSLGIAVYSLFYQILGILYPFYDMIMSYITDFMKYVYILECKNILSLALESRFSNQWGMECSEFQTFDVLK